ncbi:hypothetical protein JHK86_026866 [Glycine max]|nr:hypothetical protein JHK86_026866 [Glycine max]
MSYSSVCQGLQSSIEPWLMEPRVLKLKLAPPGSKSNNTSTHSPVTPPPSNTNDAHGKNWSFFQSLSNISHCKEPQIENVYVHPSVKSSSSMLSAKSLELCTESLGCETGSNSSDNTDDMSLFFSLESCPSLRSNNNTPVINKNSESKRLNRGSTFPPPLTSMGGVRVRSHREDGRLILEAVTSSSPQPYFQVERGDGRLRLRLFESVASAYYEDDDGVADDEALNQEDAVVEEDLEEYIGNAEDEIGVTKFVRPSRCKESGKRVIFGDGYFEHFPLSLCL